MSVIKWPANSSDLNPIENIWGWIKQELSYLVIRDFNEFQQKVFEIWENISHQYLTSLIDSMPSRLEQCIAAKGGVYKLLILIIYLLSSLLIAIS